jgi:hypothetical protein
MKGNVNVEGRVKRTAMMVLWPSFLTAVLAEGFFFSLFEPETLAQAGDATLSPTAVYSIGFLLFWSLCALTSLITCYLQAVPGSDNPPF